MTTEIWTYHDATFTDLDLTGFEVEGRDGAIGRVEQAARAADGAYLVIDPGVAMPLGRRVLVPAGLVDTVDLAERRLRVRLTREQVREAPEYDATRPFDASVREAFASHFRRGDASRESEAGPPSESERPRSSAQRPTRRRTPSRGRRQAQTTSSRRTRRTPTRTTRRSSTSARRSEKTREELYQEAKRLGIEGRSKMNKAALSRAVSRARGRSSGGRTTARGRSGRANPIEVQRFLEGVGYPVRKGELVDQAKNRRAKRAVRDTLERLPDRRFSSPTEVSKAIGRLR